jgi:SecD/SecF fusion protein
MFAATAFYEDPLTLFLTGLGLMILFFWYFATEIERRKRNVGTVLIVGVTALCLLAVTPLKERLKGGIDILGGSSFSLRIQPRESENGEKQPITKEQIDQAITVIEQRLNAMGTSEPQISQQGEDGILLQMPGVEPEESARIRGVLEKVAKLELREVSQRTGEVGPDGKDLATRVMEKSEIVPGYRSYMLTQKDQDGKESSRPILLSRKVGLGGSDIAVAYPSQQQADAVSITLNAEGTDKMIALTKNMQPGRDSIAIVLDGVVISAPTVQSVPLGKQFEVSGLHEPGEVKELANALMNPLENPLVVDEERTVSPLLGAAVVEQGIWSGILGLALTFLFILVYYRVAGFIALVALSLNVVLLFGVMAMFGFTFSLPGIAGIVLTIGMAVDANVLINERLREELALGKPLKAAVAAAYEKAFSAIFDSNITSLITAVILFWLSSSSVKGFAVTLTIGLLCSMFTAILGTRVLFRWGIDLGILKKLSFLNLIRATRFDFLAKRKLCAVFSLALIALSIAGFAWKKEQALGVDFTGGTRIQFLLGKDLAIPAEKIEAALKGLTLNKAAFPQDETNPTTGHLLTVRCDSRDAKIIEDRLRESFPVLSEKITDSRGEHYKIDASKEEVSGFIGGSFLKSSVLALVLGLIGIMIYVTVRFEFSYALGAFVALLHDCIIAIGVVVLLGQELSMIHVGAILTIAGYSINDTIIIFDRIRESLHFHRGSQIELMNEAINATLSRTILTSAATLVSVLSLAILGGAALREFSVVILVGIIIGTYSSIFVASPIVLWFGRFKKPTTQPSDGLEEVISTKVIG